MSVDPDLVAKMVKQRRAQIQAGDLEIPAGHRRAAAPAPAPAAPVPAAPAVSLPPVVEVEAAPDQGGLLASLLDMVAGAASAAADAAPAEPRPIPAARKTGAPISRAWIDASLPLWRILVSLLLIGYSSVSTTLGVRDDLTPIEQLLSVTTLPINGQHVALTLLGGILAAALLQVAQFWLAERHKPSYVLALIADAYYTRRQTLPWAAAILTTAFVSDPATTESILWAFVIAFGLWLIRSEIMRRSVNPWVMLMLGALVAAAYALTIGAMPTDDPIRLGSRWVVLQSAVWLSAIAVAYFGEVLLFGPRRR